MVGLSLVDAASTAVPTEVPNLATAGFRGIGRRHSSAGACEIAGAENALTINCTWALALCLSLARVSGATSILRREAMARASACAGASSEVWTSEVRTDDSCSPETG